MKSLSFRWLLSLPACMFYCLAASGLHASLGSPNGMPAVAALLATAFLASSIALWVLSDAQRHHRSLPYDFGSLVFLAWPVVTPIYLFRTRGWRGLAQVGWFLLLYVAASAVSLLAWFLAFHR